MPICIEDSRRIRGRERVKLPIPWLDEEGSRPPIDYAIY